MKNKHQAAAPPATTGASSAEPRRGFFVRAAAVVVGGLVGTVPLLSGLVVFLDPLRRKGGAAQAIRVATFDALPDDGIPRQFPVIADRQDAWNRYLNEPIGAVYLVRKPGEDTVAAFNATCPHAGCFVAYRADQKCFGCPCHKSAFEIDGARIDPKSSPSPRDMDTLKCEVRTPTTRGGEHSAVKEVWVEFQNFQIATAEKIAKA